MAGGTPPRLLVGLDRSGLLDHVEAAVLATTLDGVILYANPYCEVLYGRSPDWLVGRQSQDYAVEPVPREVQQEIGRAILAGQTWEGEFRVRRGDGSLVAVHAIDSPLFGEDRDVVGVVSVAFDVTEQHAREDRMRREIGVARFLADAGTILSSSLDYPETLHRLAGLSVPFLADLCLIDVAEGNTIRRVAAVHADPEKQVLADQLEARAPDLAGEHPVARVMRGGEPEVQSNLDDGLLRAIARDEQHLQLVKALEFTSYMSLPLIARGYRLGVLTLVSSGSGRHFGPDDLVLAEDVARRAALALDNARLYSDRLHVARALQSSLLPPSLPDIPGVAIAARFLPAGRGHEVGGDFYDVFEVAPDRWVLVVGDVSGKGPEAGAIAGLARHTLRAAALRERTPSHLLQVLHEALRRAESAEERFCTVCLAALDMGTRRSLLRRRAGAISVALSCGGHPAPVVVRADAGVEMVDCAGTLLGMTETVRLEDRSLALRAGDALVLYTDGVTEAQDANREFFGEQRLLEVLRTVAGTDAATVANRVLEAATTHSHGDPRDDIAVLVLQLPPS